ncbi:hypothetical protein [Collinsella bouchesdurhonensis]|uniref:hypothetical protein n=1 Tax=Collinsella bouchesdurhonensis TaxID=1907654 RepID=UPI00058DD62D|nr:hypothetical protein [Collinsella bouchesdurhonensis]
MSNNRKMLKVLSLAQIVFAVLCFVMASLVFNGTPRVEGDVDIPTFLMVNLDAVLCTVAAFLTAFCAIDGIKGANRPTALGAHLVVAVLVAAAGIAACILSPAVQGLSIVCALDAVLAIAAAVFDKKVRAEADR